MGAEGADAALLAAQQRGQCGIPRDTTEAAGRQGGIASQPSRKHPGVAADIGHVARLVVAGAAGDATDHDAAAAEGHAPGVEIGLVADLDRSQRPGRQRRPDRASKGQRAAGVAGGEVDADGDRRSRRAREPRQPPEPVRAEQEPGAARTRPGARRRSGSPRGLVGRVAPDAQRDRRPLRGAEGREQARRARRWDALRCPRRRRPPAPRARSPRTRPARWVRDGRRRR